MDYIISQDRLNSYILSYIENNYTPDYEWGPHLHEFYNNQVFRYGIFEFLIDDDVAFTYFYYDKSVSVEYWVSRDLYSYFGDSWKPIFKKWIESNTGLVVDSVSAPQ